MSSIVVDEKSGGEQHTKNYSFEDFVKWLKDTNNEDLLDIFNSLDHDKQRKLWDDAELLESFCMQSLVNCDDDEAYEMGLDHIDYIEECGFDPERHNDLAFMINMFKCGGAKDAVAMREIGSQFLKAIGETQ